MDCFDGTRILLEVMPPERFAFARKLVNSLEELDGAKELLSDGIRGDLAAVTRSLFPDDPVLGKIGIKNVTK